MLLFDKTRKRNSVFFNENQVIEIFFLDVRIDVQNVLPRIRGFFVQVVVNFIFVIQLAPVVAYFNIPVYTRFLVVGELFF